MEELKTKKPVRRRMRAANSPEPTGPVPPVPPADPSCGHGGCGVACKVRYVGPTSHIRDEHILHAARGMTHVWTAAIVTGFAVILTATIAFNAVQAKTDARAAVAQSYAQEDLDQKIQSLSDRLSAVEQSLQRVEATLATGSN